MKLFTVLALLFAIPAQSQTFYTGYIGITAHGSANAADTYRDSQIWDSYGVTGGMYLPMPYGPRATWVVRYPLTNWDDPTHATAAVVKPMPAQEYVPFGEAGCRGNLGAYVTANFMTEAAMEQTWNALADGQRQTSLFKGRTLAPSAFPWAITYQPFVSFVC